MRIDKFLSNLKYGSRKQIKDFLRVEEVMVSQKRITDPMADVNPSVEDIYLNGEKIFYKDHVNLAIYKPKGFLSANKDKMHPCITELIQTPYNRFDYGIAGRLDMDSEGLLILTTDGELAHHIMHPKTHMEKTYEVTLDREFKSARTLLKGVTIKDGKDVEYFAKALSVKVEQDKVIIVIDEGKFHQVKRMFLAVGYEVLNLKRTKIGKLSLGDLAEGQYRLFERNELI
jgi:16S rRNA pseudouridine516 synthase